MKMIAGVLPCVLHYANAATNLVPDYGKKHVCLFAAALFVETSLRFSNDGDALKKIFFWKGPQIISCLLANSAFNSSYRVAIPTVVSTLALSTSGFYNVVANLSQVVKINNVTVASLNAERPPLISIFASAMEVANIASKIINSLAVGLVVQKAFTGQTEGKIRVVVSAALLLLSALNIYHRLEISPVEKE